MAIRIIVIDPKMNTKDERRTPRKCIRRRERHCKHSVQCHKETRSAEKDLAKKKSAENKLRAFDQIEKKINLQGKEKCHKLRKGDLRLVHR